jgi:SAM-dependent methyltransferase
VPRAREDGGASIHMHVGAIPDTFVERVLHRLGLLPTPLLDTTLAFMLARAVMVATKLGVFDALANGPLSAREIAHYCGASEGGMAQLLGALTAAQYLRTDGNTFEVRPVVRRWLLGRGGDSLRDGVLFSFLEWRFVEHFEEFVRTGSPLDVHAHMREGDWDLYQRGMRSRASLTVREVVWRTPVPRRPRRLLDLGGAHGLYAAAFCRRHPTLTAGIVELPNAIDQAAPLLAEEHLGPRVVFEEGDVRSMDFGTATVDVVFMANVAHHLSEDENMDLARRVARALKRDGYFVIAEFIRSAGRGAQMPMALADLYFAATSASGTWAFAEMAQWQRAAGLTPLHPKRLVSAPGGGLQIARKL